MLLQADWHPMAKSLPIKSSLSPSGTGASPLTREASLMEWHSWATAAHQTRASPPSHKAGASLLWCIHYTGNRHLNIILGGKNTMTDTAGVWMGAIGFPTGGATEQGKHSIQADRAASLEDLAVTPLGKSPNQIQSGGISGGGAAGAICPLAHSPKTQLATLIVSLSYLLCSHFPRSGRSSMLKSGI